MCSYAQDSYSNHRARYIYIDMKQWVVTFDLMGPKVHGFLDGYLVAGRRHEVQDMI